MSPEKSMPSAPRRILHRPIVLVGMMGSGKSSIGRRLAARLGLPFADADREIEQAAGCTVREFFIHHGETEFRIGERRVIARLLNQGMMVLATGGGAFIQDATRDVIQAHGVSVWLKTDMNVLIRRVGQGRDRPMLQQTHDDPAEAVRALLAKREPVYALADITVPTGDQPLDAAAERVLEALVDYAGKAEVEAGFMDISP